MIKELQEEIEKLKKEVFDLQNQIALIQLELINSKPKKI